MRYVKVFSDMWISEDFKSLTSNEKVLFMYLLSCEHCNAIGFYRLPIGYINADIGVDSKTIETCLASLEKRGMISYDKQSSMVLVRNYLRWNFLENDNQMKSAVRSFEQLKRTHLDCEFVQVVNQYCPHMIEKSATAKELLEKGFDNGSETVTEPLSNGSETVADSEEEEEYRIQKQNKKSSCSEPSEKSDSIEAAPSSPVFLELPCIVSKKNPTGLYAVTEAEIEEHHQIFPALDIHQEFRDMLGWLKAKPANKKSDVKSFIYRWLKKSQDKAPASQPRNQTPTGMAPSAMRTNDAFKGHKSGKIDF
ncbi:hypothetical protein SDC9_59753 [bioreactor metagenome]|uniref:Phage replisome organiser N-terminal domain-containing protein n=1 Tax=bioreactor metagenome TaxID=1076179 RepID=A0A644XAY9_9ZZZZ